MNHAILSRLIFPASTAKALKNAPSSVFLKRVRRYFKPCTILSKSSQKPKICFNEILKENVPFTVGDWLRYICLAANPLLSALAAVVDVSLYHS